MHSEIIVERLSIMIESIFFSKALQSEATQSITKQYTIPRCPHFQEKNLAPFLGTYDVRIRSWVVIFLQDHGTYSSISCD